MWRRYKAQPSFVLGFHGCDEAFGEAVLAGKKQFEPSKNAYDWLGTGCYFWEANPQRALDFARESMGRPQLTKGKIKTPFALGAIIDLGLCCNLFDSSAIDELAAAHDTLARTSASAGNPMPENKGPGMEFRLLDRAVIETMHAIRAQEGLPAYDTVRAGFMEGDALYPGAGFTAKSHIQIAVKSTACIKGFFRPIPHTEIGKPRLVWD